ncbi:MAG: TolC family protein [bacterium]
MEVANLRTRIVCPSRKLVLPFLLVSLSVIPCNFSALWAQEKPERVLTLAESIKLAQSNNQELLILSEEENIAEAKIKLARSQKYPQIIFSGAYTTLKIDTPVTLSPMLGGATLNEGVSEYYTSLLSLRQFLYTGGYLSSTSKEAQLNLQEVESDYRALKGKIVLGVTRNYYQVLLNRQIVNIYESALTQSENIQNLIKEQKGGGELYDYNSVKADVQLMVIKSSLEKARQDMEENRTVFNRSVGIELNTQVQLDGQLTYEEPQEFELNKSITRALQFSPELNRKKIEEEMYDVRVTLSKGKLYPSVIMGGDIAYSGEIFPPKGKSWTATIAVSYPIFDGWASLTRIKQAKSELRKTKLERVNLSDDLKLRIQQLHYNYERTKKAVKPLKDSRDLSAQSVQLATEAFKKGKISFSELLSAEMTLTQAEINYLQNLHGYLSAAAELNIITNPVE